MMKEIKRAMEMAAALSKEQRGKLLELQGRCLAHYGTRSDHNGVLPSCILEKALPSISARCVFEIRWARLKEGCL